MRDWGDSLKSWLPPSSVHRNKSLRDRTTLKIGGSAKWCVEVEEKDQMVRLIREARLEGVSWFLLGGGSNVLFSDGGYDGLVIVNRIGGLSDLGNGQIECGAGVPLMDVVRFARSKNHAGFESLAGIPGSLGGAIVGNAGAFGRDIGELLESVELVTESGEVERVHPDSLEIDYRETRLKYSKDVVLSARFQLAQSQNEDLSKAIEDILALRREKHPPDSVPTAGSFFKNLPATEPGGRRIAAGLLLDRAGAKGLAVGNAAVFEKHANIVVNRGAASAKDVLNLTSQMKRLVFDHSGTVLEEEVRRIGFPDAELSQIGVQEAFHR